MKGILDQMLQMQQFTPSTVEEYFALQLAKRLSDEVAIRLHIQHTAHHEPEFLIQLFHRIKLEADAVLMFHESLNTENR